MENKSKTFDPGEYHCFGILWLYSGWKILIIVMIVKNWLRKNNHTTQHLVIVLSFVNYDY